jgi:hypothetical protein
MVIKWTNAIIAIGDNGETLKDIERYLAES